MSFSFGFGNTQPSTGAASTGFSFGGASAAPAAAPTTAPASTGFSFGSAAAAPAAAPASTGFSFGSAAAAPAAAPASTGFSFGSAAAAPAAAPASTGFSFGSAAAAPAAAPASTGFSFGSTAAAPASAPASTGFSFGAAPTTTTTTTAPANTGFSFGGAATTAPTSSFGGFGATTTAPGATTTNTGFGGFGGFGSSTTAAANPAAPPTSNPLMPGVISSGAIPIPFHPAAVQDPLLTRMNAISSQYDYSSKNNSFQTILYNRIPVSMHSKLVKPPHANDKLWAAGVNDNPDPTNLVPCLIVGFPDLIARVNEQYKALKNHDEVLAQVNETVKTMTSSMATLQSDTNKIQSTQRDIDLRYMKLLNRLSIYRSQSFPLMDTELDYLSKLKNIQSELTKSSNSCTSKIQELQNVLELNAQNNKGNVDTPDLDQEQVRVFSNILNEQRDFILQLTQTVQADKQYLDDFKQTSVAK